MGGRNLIKAFGAGAFGLAALLCIVGPAWAEGTERLGPPNIPIATGSGFSVGGVGLETSQPALIAVDVPASSSIKQVLIYWEGQNDTPSGDDTIVVAGTPVTGTLIGGPTLFFETSRRGKFYSSTYRADITALGVVTAGPNSISVGGLDFDQVNDGAGIFAIYDDGTAADISVFDGNDLAFINFAPPLDTTTPQTFTFAPAGIPRSADLGMFFSSVSGPDRAGDRPSLIEVTIDGITTQFNDAVGSFDGNEWDTFHVKVIVPPGATTMTVHAVSADADGDGQDPLAASFAWIAAALSLERPAPEPTTTIAEQPTTTRPTTTVTPTTATPTTSTPSNVLPATSTPSTSSIPRTTENAPTVTTTTIRVTELTTLPPTSTTTVLLTAILPETGSTNSRLPLGAGSITLVSGLALVALARRRQNT